MSAIRIIQTERDADTNARSILDLREYDVPTTPTPDTWTALTRDTARRAMLLDRVRQIDALATGAVDEITIVHN